MPEGPEVKTMADSLQDLTGKQIISVSREGIPLNLNPQQLPLTVTQVRCRGKKIIMSCQDAKQQVGHFLVVPLMTGIVRRKAPGKHTRCTWIFGQPLLPGLWMRTEHVYFDDSRKLGEVSYLSEDELNLRLSELGPDIIGSSAEELYAHVLKCVAKLRGTTTIAKVLLEQHIFCGVGNYLRSDILYLCKIHPLRQMVNISQQEWFYICQVTVWLLHKSYAAGGYSLRDYVLANGAKGTYESYVYGRKQVAQGSQNYVVMYMKYMTRGIYYVEGWQI